MRTITRRKIEALGWFDNRKNIIGVIKVHTWVELGTETTDLGKTQYFVGTTKKTEDAHADACKIIETGQEISKDTAEEIIKINKERKKK